MQSYCTVLECANDCVYSSLYCDKHQLTLPKEQREFQPSDQEILSEITQRHQCLVDTMISAMKSRRDDILIPLQKEEWNYFLKKISQWSVGFTFIFDGKTPRHIREFASIYDCTIENFMWGRNLWTSSVSFNIHGMQRYKFE